MVFIRSSNIDCITRLENTGKSIQPGTKLTKVSSLKELFSIFNPEGVLVFSYRMEGFTSESFSMELSLAPGWKDMPWIVMASSNDYPAAEEFQRRHPQVKMLLMEPVSDEALVEIWSYALTPALVANGHSPVVAKRFSSETGITPLPSSSMSANQNEKLIKHLIHSGATDYFLWNMTGQVVDLSGDLARSLSVEMQFSITVSDKTAKECGLGELLELHALGGRKSAVLFSVQPDLRSADSLRIAGLLLDSNRDTTEVITQARGFVAS